VNDTFLAVMLASCLACAVTSTGIYVIGRFEEWGRRNTVYFMSFAAGVLVSVSFIHIIPESFQMHSEAPVFFLAGFLALYLLNRFLRLYICDDRGHGAYTLGIIPLVGIGFHSFIDGIIYSVTFNVSIFMGALAAIGMILHEFPEGIVTFLLLEWSGFGKKRAAIYAFLAAAVSTPLGTLVSYPFVADVERSTLGILLALSAGALVYVGASHLLPEVEKENKRYSLIALMVGVLVAAIVVTFKG
jgi:zinc and cadmium transporter